MKCSKTDCRYEGTIVCSECNGSTYYFKIEEHTSQKKKTPRTQKTKARKVAYKVPFDGITWGTFYE